MRPVKKIAVMQPYFYPYAGYFRLFHAVDHFVVLDSVQFMRRGRVHRCQLPGSGDEEWWLTLPINKCPLSTDIADIRFRDDAPALFEARIDQALQSYAKEAGYPAIRKQLLDRMDIPVDYLCRQLTTVTRLLQFEAEISRSSESTYPMDGDYQDRIIGIVKAHEGTDYVNLTGGVDLYDADRFSRAGIRLHFLAPYTGEFQHLIPALIQSSADDIRADIIRTTQFIND